MLIQLILKKNKTVSLSLYNNHKKRLDKIIWQEENNLGHTLLINLDKLLKRNQLKPFQIKRITLSSDIENQFTTQRIAQTVTQSFNYSLRISRD